MTSRAAFWVTGPFPLPEVLALVASLGGTVEYSDARGGKPGRPGSAYAAWSIPAGGERAVGERLAAAAGSTLRALEPDEIAFPACEFGDATAESLRVGPSSPTVTDAVVAYRFVSPEHQAQIYRVFDEFRRNADWTHFVCFPIAPNFPHLKEALAALLAAWGVQGKGIADLNLFHLTLALFVLKSDDDVSRMQAIVENTIRETEWPADRTLTFPSLGTFGVGTKTRILWAAPAGAFSDALDAFVAKLAENARSGGFTRMCLGTPLHGTLLRPNHVSGPRTRTFDARPMIAAFAPDSLPPIEAAELRLVQRYKFDEDQFYHTVGRFTV
jgi:hypothetical protein